MQKDADDVNNEHEVSFCFINSFLSCCLITAATIIVVRNMARNLVFGFLIPKFWYLWYYILVREVVTEIDIHIRSLDGAKTIIPT